MAEWQPIETAPKDGSWILLARAGSDLGCARYEVARYRPHFWPSYEPVGDGLYRKIETPIHEWEGSNNAHRATHWMPLPEPPDGA